MKKVFILFLGRKFDWNSKQCVWKLCLLHLTEHHLVIQLACSFYWPQGSVWKEPSTKKCVWCKLWCDRKRKPTATAIQWKKFPVATSGNLTSGVLSIIMLKPSISQDTLLSNLFCEEKCLTFSRDAIWNIFCGSHITTGHFVKINVDRF